MVFVVLMGNLSAHSGPAVREVSLKRISTCRSQTWSGNTLRGRNQNNPGVLHLCKPRCFSVLDSSDLFFIQCFVDFGSENMTRLP